MSFTLTRVHPNRKAQIMNTRSLLLALLGLLFWGLVGCGSNSKPTDTSTNNQNTSTATANWQDYQDKLQKPLFDVATSTTPAETASRLKIDEHEVIRVVIELKAGAALPVGYLVLVESRSENQIQAWVRIDQLLELSRQDAIQNIRIPAKPIPH
ncbi:hypothetical protein HY229_01870 [Candidatus Acetothermia bacterium]|nr:hypothetical protein [Candidatus Acetothermia bacterium]MBI3642835.1 hypothetical protein [Candidatus Acetothermia bacterium]